MALAASLGASFECPREVAPGFRCDVRVLCTCTQACRARHEALHGAEARVKHRIVPAHGLGKELHGLLFGCCASEAAGSQCLPGCSSAV